MKPQLSLLLTASLLLAGCANGPTPKPQAVSMAAWTAPASADQTDVTMNWWTALHDPALDALVQRAFERNAEIRAASANLEAANALASEARATLLPSGQANASLARGRVAGLAQPPIPGTPDRLPSQTLAIVGASLGWEADLFGRMRANLDGARAKASEALWLRRQSQAAVAAAVVRAYAEYGWAGRAAILADERAEALAAQLDSARKAHALGAASSADVERNQLALAQAQAEIAPLKAQQANAARRLATLTGETPRPTIEGARRLSPPDSLRAGDPTGLLRRRPDVAAAEQRWAAAAAEAKVAVADLYPRITLGGQVGLSAKPDRLGEAGALNFGIGPSLTWGVFDLPRLRARVKAADAGAEAALAQWEGVVLSALEEADASLETWNQARTTSHRLSDAAASSTRIYTAAQARQAAGALSPAGLQAARVETLTAQAAADEARSRELQAWIAAQLALGAGWGLADRSPPSATLQ